jgi:hypothetical protein
MRISNAALDGYAPTSSVLNATLSSMKKETARATSSAARTAERNSSAERSTDDPNPWVTSGKQYTTAEIDIMRRNRHLKTSDLLQLLPPYRSRQSVQAKRDKTPGLGFQRLPWRHGEDEELRRLAPTRGPSAVRRVLPHRTRFEIQQRAQALGIELFNPWDKPLAIIGEPLADAIRKRAREDGLSMRGLDCELGTSAYFTNVAALRARRGSGPYMPAIRKAVEFFEAELATGPDGTITIDWKDY